MASDPTNDTTHAEDTAAGLIALAAESFATDNQELVHEINSVVSNIVLGCSPQEVADLIFTLIEISATFILEEEKNGN